VSGTCEAIAAAATQVVCSGVNANFVGTIDVLRLRERALSTTSKSVKVDYEITLASGASGNTAANAVTTALSNTATVAAAIATKVTAKVAADTTLTNANMGVTGATMTAPTATLSGGSSSNSSAAAMFSTLSSLIAFAYVLA
jgi:hypothetical protein